MLLYFSKMHGLGNDFMVIDLITQNISLTTKFIKKFSDRNLGVGFDQLLIIEKSKSSNVDFNYRIFNNDSSEVENCVNGSRCLAKFIFDNYLTYKKKIKVKTINNIITLKKKKKNILVEMDNPIFNPLYIPFLRYKDKLIHKIKIYINNIYIEIYISVVSIGNPHSIILFKNLKKLPLNELGYALQISKYFPKKVNVSFIQIISCNIIIMRVFERGVGETLACGTAACAAAVTGIRRGLLTNNVYIYLPGGKLNVCWNGNNINIIGPAEKVFDGYINII
ncbi:Diaminopimelate epimerase [Candidatus Johnevansia muelleri]|uniref:Diaminopimelate epimerase n=1 Tax=Candidatus Johnevansia muelleri TaxID=1495769 RepID=A0A078KBL6_9GAMM|nr:Diaminopimelate epimerase [Candidatus Evansia muelleri]